MPKREIVKFKERDSEWIGYADREPLFDFIKIVESNSTYSLEELAQLCDMEAKSRNNHSYVGAHRLLAALLRNMLCREIATDIMLEIAKYGGLDGMMGMSGKPSAYDDLGIKPPWDEWELKD